MTPAKTFLASIFCAALVCASVGATRDLQQASSTCSVRASAAAWSFNQAVCKRAYNSTTVEAHTTFCQSPYDYVPSEISQTVEASMSVAVTAIATAAAKTSFSATISPSCEPGSYAYFYASARAKAVAKSVAQSFVAAWSTVVGPDAWTYLGADVYAAANALAQTCETKYTEILGDFHLCYKDTCGPTSCSVKCNYWNDECATATATAIAEAYVSVQALVQFYFLSEGCDHDCEVQMCQYVCPDGC